MQHGEKTIKRAFKSHYLSKYFQQANITKLLKPYTEAQSQLLLSNTAIVSTIKMRFSIAAIITALLATAAALPHAAEKVGAGMFSIYTRTHLDTHFSLPSGRLLNC